MWERSFVAASVLMGEPVEVVLAALPEGGGARTAELADKLRDPRRAARAQSLAVVAQEIVVALSEVTLR